MKSSNPLAKLSSALTCIRVCCCHYDVVSVIFLLLSVGGVSTLPRADCPLLSWAISHSQKQVRSAPLDLLLPQMLLTHLMDADGSLSEAGYLVATLEAAVSFITQVEAACTRLVC